MASVIAARTDGSLSGSVVTFTNVDVQAGDLVVVASCRGAVISSISGLTFTSQVGANNFGLQVDGYTAVAGSTTTIASIAVTYGTVTSVSCVLYVIRGANTTTPVRGTATRNVANAEGAGPFTTSTVSVQSGDVLLGIGACIYGNGLTVESGFTAAVNAANATHAYKVAVATSAQNVSFTTVPGGEDGIIGLLVIAGAAASVAPDAPTTLAADLITTPGTVALTWALPGTGAARTSVKVERNVNGGAFATLTTLGASAVNHGDTTQLTGNTYQYRVLATNGVGDSAASNTVTANFTGAGGTARAASPLGGTLVRS